jgi:hypothetical protein
MGRPVLYGGQQKARHYGRTETKQHLVRMPPDGIADSWQQDPAIELCQPAQHGQGREEGPEQEERPKPQAEQRNYLFFFAAIQDLMHGETLIDILKDNYKVTFQMFNLNPVKA